MRVFILRVVSLLALASSSLGVKLYTAPDQLSTKEYDFIIAGGGTAGCVLASRLSENPDVSVLLVEAGGDHREVFNSIVPFLAGNLVNSAVDWNLTTVPQPGFADRSILFQRGHVLGGSSSVNYMAYNRASNDFYNSWAKGIGDDRWSWKSLEPFYKRHHKLAEPADGHDCSDQVVRDAHGDGPVEVSVLNYPVPIDDMVMRVSGEMGGRFSWNQDINAGDSLGFTYTQSSIGNGKRSSSATAYLDPLFESNRKNLDILINTHVTKLVQAGTSKGKPEFKTVELAQPKPGQLLTPDDDSTAGTTDDGKRYKFHAKKEVILSTGVIGTPKILQLSGIGPKDVLQKLDIETIVEIPDVGKNLTDHPMSVMYWNINQESQFDTLLRDPAQFAAQIQHWQETHKGIMAGGVSGTQSYMRLPESHPIFAEISDPSSGPHSGHTELLFGEGMIPITNIPMPDSGNYVYALAVLTSPTSRGDMQISSSDTFAAPKINPNYLATEFDRAAMVQAMRDTFTFLSHEAFKNYIDAPYGSLVNLTTDEELLKYTADHGVTINHGIGTAKMSPYGAEWGVVDPDLKVKEVIGVRVVDASVFVSYDSIDFTKPVLGWVDGLLTRW
ncbi:GMC oxidoreductase-domain-containing protein [Lophiotrema nucula]|uniref:GMC oxidoreductase-domain-containing protein n=1 Tax=Lophiotrema nucula TaxID=690887 RepID=A0A6A5YJF2_9PLEO|nr:GMC oxidoreductase-domain-containing protein [Lophiotrema nucula]